MKSIKFAEIDAIQMLDLFDGVAGLDSQVERMGAFWLRCGHSQSYGDFCVVDIGSDNYLLVYRI